MFKKIVDKIIAFEVEKKKEEINEVLKKEEMIIVQNVERDRKAKIDLLEIKLKDEENKLQLLHKKRIDEIKKHQDGEVIEYIKNEDNKLKKIAEEYDKRKDELSKQLEEKCKSIMLISERDVEVLNSEYNKRKSVYSSQIAELNELTDQVKRKISELSEIRCNAELTQKQLWERLDILRDGLQTEQIWMKLWECAYSKAVDTVWSVLKKETIRLIELAKEDGYKEAEERLAKQYENKLNDIISKCENDINIPLIFKRKEKVTLDYLHAQKCKDSRMENYYLGQKEFIEEICDGKNN